MSLKKVVCFVMAFVLLVLNIPFVSSAVEERDESAGITLPPTENTSLQDVYGNIPIDSEPIYEYDIPASEELWQLGPDEMSYAELQAIKFEDVVFPEVISVEKAEEKGHVNRLKAQEKNLNSIIYQNRDGGKTAYIYDYPVKYYDADGNVRDRSTRIESNVADGYAYSMWDNSVQAHFSQNSSGGVLLSSGEISIKMTPISSSVGQNAVQANDNTVIYGKVFDGSVILVYTSLMSGIKEDIVLSHFGGQNSFEFSLEADGLEALEQSNGIWVLVSGDTVVAEFERIVINDSAGNTVYGEMDIQPASDGSYTITVSAPLDFLESEETVYPVYIDPTLYIWETNSYYTGYDYIPYDSIIDVGLYETQDDYDYNWDTYHIFVLGSCDGMEGEGKIIYKLPDFYNSEYGLYTDMRREQISSAMLYIETMSDEGMSVYAYPMTSTYTEGAEEPIQLWDAELSSAYDANKGIYSYLTSTGLQEVNITSIVQGWADFNNGLSSAASDNPMNGFVLAASNPAYGISIKSTEYGSAGSDAYVMIDYSPIGGEYYIVNTNAGVSLQGDAWESTIPYVDKLSTSVENRWLIEYIGGGKHVIRSLSDTDYYLSSLTGSPRIAGGLVGNTEKWQIVSAGGGYRLNNVSNTKYLYTNGTSLSFVANTDTSEGSRWGLVLKSDYVHITDIELNDNWLKPAQTKYFDVKTVPSNATWRGVDNFTWTVSNSSVVTTTANSGFLSGVSAGRATLTLTHKLTGYTKTFSIVCGSIREGTYMIMNKGTGRYMDVEGSSMSSGAYIQQWDYHTGDHAKWTVTMSSSGVYSIVSKYSDLYVISQQAALASFAKIMQYDYETSTMLCNWRFEETSSGAYKIIPTIYSNYVLSVPTNNNQNGTDLILSTYTNNTNYYDEWILYKIDYEATIYNYYDMGYCVRYGETAAESESRIKEYSLAVSERYLELFGLSLIVMDTEYYESSIDVCKGTVTSSNIDTLCTHSGTIHTDLNNVIFDFMNEVESGNSTTTCVLWSGHKIPFPDTEDFNRSCSYLTSVYMLEDSDDSVRYRDSISILMHELNHQYGALDHYHELIENDNSSVPKCISGDICSECGSAKRSVDCIMNEPRQDISSEIIMCDLCKHEVLVHLSDHHDVS